MRLSPKEAKECICILRETSGSSDNFPPGRRHRCKEQNCVACTSDSCFAYWRWSNVEKTEGYCSLGGKPEF